MKNVRYMRYYFITLFGVLAASYYPLSMGFRVIFDMITKGAVSKEDYPKYVIPYTPICVAIIFGVLMMPLCLKLFKKFSLLSGVLLSVGVFFSLELFLEEKIIVESSETFYTRLDDWQMYLCRAPVWSEPVTRYDQKTAVEILMGEYSPAFKLHFYVISVLLILAVLGCIYGFGQIVMSKDKNRLKSLIVQSVCTLSFLSLCILACFTAFWRDGSIEVSPLSAILMALFFILMGVTAGLFTGSFMLGKRRLLSLYIPAIVSSLMTLLMYIGEMILLNGHLYILGEGFPFVSIPLMVLSLADIFIIIASGCVAAGISYLLNKPKREG